MPSGMAAAKKSLPSAYPHKWVRLDFNALWHGGVKEEVILSLLTKRTHGLTFLAPFSMQRQKRVYLQFAQTDDTRLEFSAFWPCDTKEVLTFILPTQLARCTLWHCQGRAYLQNAYTDEKRLDLAPSGMTAPRKILHSSCPH